MDILIKLIGMLLTILPFIQFTTYIIKHSKEKTSFDYRIKKIKDKKGKKGLIIAYINKILYGTSIIFIGLNLLCYFEYDLYTKILVLSLVLYVITKYIDINNER